MKLCDKVNTLVAPLECWLILCLWEICFIHNVCIMTSVFCESVYRLYALFIHFFGCLGRFHWMCQAALWNTIDLLDIVPWLTAQVDGSYKLQLCKDSVIWKIVWIHSLRLNTPNEILRVTKHVGIVLTHQTFILNVHRILYWLLAVSH